MGYWRPLMARRNSAASACFLQSRSWQVWVLLGQELKSALEQTEETKVPDVSILDPAHSCSS